MKISGFDQGSLEVSRSGQLFFQPRDLHVESTDLLVQFGLERLALVMVATSAVAEEGLDAVEEFFLPFADLDRVDLVGPFQLGEGLGLVGGIEGDFGLKRRRVSFR